MITLTLHQGIQTLLEQVYLNPESYTNSFQLIDRKINFVHVGAHPIEIGSLNTDMPSVALRHCKIKSWRMDRNSKYALSLAVNLVI